MPITTDKPVPERASIWRRLAWFVALWAMGVMAVGTVATVLRWLLRP